MDRDRNQLSGRIALLAAAVALLGPDLSPLTDDEDEG